MKRIWENWKAFSKKLGNFQAGVVFSILYYTVVTPMGLILSLFKDFMSVRGFPKWISMEDNASTIKKMKQQY